MSAIAGVCRADSRPVEAAEVRRLAGGMAHRGPDATGVWTSGAAGLAHGLLATARADLDEAAPLADDAGERHIVWDGRLDNREDVLDALEAPPALRAAADARLVLAAWRRWGAACPARLLGDFAFAVWDAPARTLFCARDRLGIKPFHYTWDGATFRFASEPRPLLDGGAAPDDEMVLAFLLREFRDGDETRTFVRGLHRLPAAHSLQLRDGAVRVQRYWAIDPERRIEYDDDRQYVEHFLDIFRRAVACRLRSDWPVAALLSGGLDSAAIACTAQRLYEQGGEGSPAFETFTLFSDHPDSDERPWARAVAEATGLKLHEVYGADRAPLAGLAQHLADAQSPIAGPNHESTTAILGEAAASGCRVVLSGEGGDQLVDETGYLADLLRTGRPLRFARELRTFARWYGEPARSFVADTLKMLLPAEVKYLGKRLLRRAPPPWINQPLARRLAFHRRLRRARERVAFPSLSQTDAYHSVTAPYYTLKLEVEERLAARHGMEMRYPFLDSRLVEFVVAIPWERRPGRGRRKRLVQGAMAGIVPAAVLERRGKGDWSSPTDRGLVAALRGATPDWSAAFRRYVDGRRADELVRAYARGRYGLRWEAWFLITVDRWLQSLETGERP
ncbi:MAG TPA: asparagine synthase (glutamine-hydrolyzing) [Candidatus Limnocylindria bacterium]|nr:asparagine synthase (glutamine-hydrolyzing) [Candidatus Limnocylindria bacterium]